MTMTTKGKEFWYWKTNPEWYTYDEKSGYALTDKAPEDARLIFKEWDERRKLHMETRKLERLAEAVEYSYPDFVAAMVNGAKRHNVAKELVDFMEANEGCSTDDVLEHYYTITILPESNWEAKR